MGYSPRHLLSSDGYPAYFRLTGTSTHDAVSGPLLSIEAGSNAAENALLAQTEVMLAITLLMF